MSWGLWTLVQHSGWVVGHNPQFERAVEIRAINNDEAKTVGEAGGLVFDKYGMASDVEHDENYPPEVLGLIPDVRGQFSELMVQCQKIYLPHGGSATYSTTADNFAARRKALRRMARRRP